MFTSQNTLIYQMALATQTHMGNTITTPFLASSPARLISSYVSFVLPSTFVANSSQDCMNLVNPRLSVLCHDPVDNSDGESQEKLKEEKKKKKESGEIW